MRSNSQFVYRTVAIAVILPLLILVSNGITGPDTLNRDEIPDRYKWNLSDIYPNWEAWEADLNKMQGLMDEFAGLKGTLANGPEALQNLPAPPNTYAKTLRGASTGRVVRFPGGTETSM